MDYDDYDDYGDIDDYDFQQAAKENEKRKKERERSKQASKSRKREQSSQRSQMETSTSEQPVVGRSQNISVNRQMQDIVNQYENGKSKSYSNSAPKEINVVTMGTVDAGKSSLFGKLAYLLNPDNQRVFDKLQKQADNLNKSTFTYAYYLDTNEQERERGVTMSVNTYTMTIEGKKFIMQDCPGHQDFNDSICQNILQPDMCVLVVDSSDVQRLMDYIIKQINVMLLFQPTYILVAVNKMDLIDFDINKFKQIQQDISRLITSNKIYYKDLKFDIIPTAAMEEKDNNLIEFSEKMQYATMTLKQALVSAPVSIGANQTQTPCALLIEAQKQQNGLYVYAFVDQGVLRVNEPIIIRPSNYILQVNQIIVAETKVDVATPKQHCALLCSPYEVQVPGTFSHFEIDEFINKSQTGEIIQPLAIVINESEQLQNNTLSSKEQRCNDPQITSRVRCKVMVTAENGIYAGQEFDAFIGTRLVAARINRVDAILNEDHFIVHGQFASYDAMAVIDLVLTDKCVVKIGGCLGRVILRQGVEIAAVGLICSWE